MKIKASPKGAFFAAISHCSEGLRKLATEFKGFNRSCHVLKFPAIKYLKIDKIDKLHPQIQEAQNWKKNIRPGRLKFQ